MSYKLYDIFTKQTIEIHEGEIMDKCRELGIHNASLSKLGKNRGSRRKSMQNRYILEKDKDKIFTLIEFETGKEYDCVTNQSLFMQLKCLEISPNDTKYIHQLKTGKQQMATICGKIFTLKGAVEKTRRFNKMKITCPKYEEKRAIQLLRLKIRDRVRNRIRMAVKRGMTTNTKRDTTLALLGCSISFYMEYIKAKFETGMNWDNYGNGDGKWNLEHCTPCALFDLTKEEEQRKCFHYSNTKPMWSLENAAKNDKTPEEWEEYKARKPTNIRATQGANFVAASVARNFSSGDLSLSSSPT